MPLLSRRRFPAFRNTLSRIPPTPLRRGRRGSCPSRPCSLRSKRRRQSRATRPRRRTTQKACRTRRTGKPRRTFLLGFRFEGRRETEQFLAVLVRADHLLSGFNVLRREHLRPGFLFFLHRAAMRALDAEGFGLEF